MPNDLWQAFLEETPQAAYFGYQNLFGTSPNMRKWFEGQFQRVQNKYMGALGQQIYGGGEPSMRLTDFLAQYFAPEGGAAQEWGAMTPRQRGLDFARFSPVTRWMR